MKVVFLGTPSFALEVLKNIYASKHEVVAVVCAESKPQGRGNVLTDPPTKTFADEKNIKVLQYSKIRNEGVADLKAIEADIFVTAAFGQILSQEILNIPPYGVINVHGSLLPKYRGPAPVQYALLNGETTTGVTIMQTEIGIDDGDMILKKSLEIHPKDNTETLMEKLSILGGEAVVKALDLLESGNAIFEKQDEALATKTYMLKKENSQLNFSLTAKQLENFVRAYAPNPCAKFVYDGAEFKVLEAKALDYKHAEKAGQVLKASSKEGLIIACGEGVLEIVMFNPPSSKKMSAKSYLNGKRIEVGSVLNS